MRVTQKNMYTSMTGGMNSTLADYMESVNQGTSHKRLNRPSDDPAGMARVLSYRSSIGRLSQYEKNADTAQGWLGLTDEMLSSTSTSIIKLKELAESAADGTKTPENRMQIAKQIRELFGSLLNYSNMEYEGKHIFAGQQYDRPAFREGLTVTANDLTGAAPKPPLQVEGTLPQSAIVRFERDETIPPAADLEFKYSEDGGKNWKIGTIPAGASSFDIGGARVTLPNTVNATPPGANTMTVKQGYDPLGNPDADPTEMKGGTSLIIRPTAIYQGSDNNSKSEVNRYGSVMIPPLNSSTTGTFKDNVLVKFDGAVDMAFPLPPPPATAPEVPYSYSTDGGTTWVGGNKATVVETGGPPATASTLRMPVPGGFLDMTNDGTSPDTVIPANAQLIIRPQRTELDFEIMQGQNMTVNNVGKDVFGGLFTTNGSNNLESMFGEGEGKNLFETVGRLIGYCETNNQDGISEALDELTAAQTHVMAYAAGVGGKEQRLEMVLSNLDANKFDQTSRMSSIEDVNLTELMTNLARQEMAYNTVLKSSSMIMQINLMKYM